MPTVDLVRTCTVQSTVRLRQVASMFDMPPETTPTERWNFDLDLPEDWQIGLIVGASGTGKSTIAAEVFGKDATHHYLWPEDKCILDGFETTGERGVKAVTDALSSVGFSSPPSWLKPYRVLSTGERFRSDLARAVFDLADSPLVVVDEFTSTVDRTVAQIGAAAVSKAVRRTGNRFVAVTCHSDVEPWLEPDWVLEMPSGTLHRRRLRRPSIDLDISRAHRSAWTDFRKHHYLNTSLSKAAQCYVATWRDRPVAFASVLFFPHPQAPGWREHRTVCLPDFQGVGIGMALSAYVGSLYVATGRPYRSCTSHPAMIRHRAKSPLWRMTRSPRRSRPLRRDYNRWGESAVNRMTATFEYVGEARPDAARAAGLETA